jgi:hypothetical protein
LSPRWKSEPEAHYKANKHADETKTLLQQILEQQNQILAAIEKVAST